MPFASIAGAARGRRYPVALLAPLVLLACSERPSFEPGDECELNSECNSSFICRLGRCRVECRATRDCPTGLECIRDELGLGACQLPEETECMLSSQCDPFLVCHFGRCTNVCESNRDCLPGQACVQEPGAGRGCRDQSMIECTHHSECAPMDLICAVDGRCREECHTDWDCRDGQVCFEELAPPVCDWPNARIDGGGPDGGIDGGVDGGARDAGTDAGPDDAGASVAPPPTSVLGAGFEHTCALTDALRCWGINDVGQLADPSDYDPHLTPFLVDLDGVRRLGVGLQHTCAATSTDLYCWGSNAEGQLATGSLGGFRATPEVIAGLPGPVDDLALGRGHTCAITDTTPRRLFCWGGNAEGQLGTGDEEPRYEPTEITLAGTPAQVDAYSVHTCVRLASGSVQCFGENTDGQLGNDTREDSVVPVTVVGLDDAVHIATGSTHTCAVRASGQVVCWGRDAEGQLGDGPDPSPVLPIPHPTPVAAGLDGPALQVTAGGAHTCARTATNVFCWGDNLFGQTGQDRITTFVTAPALVDGLGPAEEVTAGGSHTCVRIDASDHRCFGANRYGQLGDGSTTESHVPVEVAP